MSDTVKFPTGMDKQGYRVVRVADGRRGTTSTGWIREHTVIAERVLGRPMPVKAEVHHVNSDRSDNGAGNLVICQDHAYHMTLHNRTKALDACGHADWRKCGFCHRHSPTSELVIHGKVIRHRACKNLQLRQWHQRRREAQHD